jgi:hypothetical protein
MRKESEETNALLFRFFSKLLNAPVRGLLSGPHPIKTSGSVPSNSARLKAAVGLAQVDAIADQTAILDVLAESIDRGQSRRQCEGRDPSARVDEHRRRQNDQDARALAHKYLNCGTDFIDVRTSIVAILTPDFPAAASTSRRCNTFDGLVTLDRMPMLLAAGIRSSAISTCFAVKPSSTEGLQYRTR